MRNSVTILLLLVGVSWSAPAQTVLTLDQCLALARDRNPRIRGAVNALRMGEISHDELLTSRLPQVHLEAAPVFAPNSLRFGYDPAISNAGQVSGIVVVQQSLYDGGIRGLKSEQFQVDLERLAGERRRIERDLAFSVKQAFFEVLGSEREVRLNEESAVQLRDYLEVVRRLSNGGTASYTDVLKTQLQLSNAQLLLRKAEADFAMAKYSLAELLGGPIDTTFAISGSLEGWSTTTVDSLLMPASPDTSGSLELSIARMEIQRNLLEVEMTRRESLPVVTLAADAGYVNSGENLQLPPGDRASAVGFSVGLVLDFPLLNWGATDLRAQQRQLGVDNLRLEMDQLQRSIAAEFRKTTLQLLNALDRLPVTRQNRISAEENFLLSRSKFLGGGVLSLEVLSAQQLLTDSKRSEVQTLTEIRILAAKLEQLTTR